MSQKLTFLNIFDKAVAEGIRKRCDEVESLRWSLRNTLGFPRAVDGSTCRYSFCGHNQMTSELKEFLSNLAPTFDGFPLYEVAINRYNPGD